MIEILNKNNEIKAFHSVKEVFEKEKNFFLMQITAHTSQEVQELEAFYGLDLSIIRQFEDIEISSHFLASPTQVSFHISLPFYNENKDLEERPLFFVLTPEHFFLFLAADIEAYINKYYPNKVSQLKKVQNIKEIFDLQIEFISDYYADITESEIKKVKSLAMEVLPKEKFSNRTLNLIAKHSFSSLLIKEMLLETTRVFLLYKKNATLTHIDIQQEIDRELSDLSVVSDYIQFNTERLATLKDNVARKIDVEQNYIFKMLTIITLCVSVPTMIAGIYGMNFEHMPELSEPWGYPIVLGVMLISAIFPLLFFKIKKWF